MQRDLNLIRQLLLGLEGEASTQYDFDIGEVNDVEKWYNVDLLVQAYLIRGIEVRWAADGAGPYVHAKGLERVDIQVLDLRNPRLEGHKPIEGHGLPCVRNSHPRAIAAAVNRCATRFARLRLSRPNSINTWWGDPGCGSETTFNPRHSHSSIVTAITPSEDNP